MFGNNDLNLSPINTNNIKWGNGHVGVVDFGGQMNVVFYYKAVPNPQKSAAEGRPFFEDVAHVRIQQIGEKPLNIVDRPANNDDRRRYPNQWNAFIEQKEMIPEGTPIDMLFPEHPSVGALLRANAVHTVEQCANLSGDAIDHIGLGAQRYVNAAQKYLAQAKNGVQASEMRRELETRDQEIKILKQQLAQQKEQIDGIAMGRVAGSPAMDLNQIQNALAVLMQRPNGVDPMLTQINTSHGSNQQLVAEKGKRRRPNVG